MSQPPIIAAPRETVRHAGEWDAGSRSRPLFRVAELGPRGRAVLAVLWVLMMLAWMAGLVLGCWWVWPHIRQLTLTPDLVFSLMWLTTGATAWLVALHFGYRRFWRP